MFVQERASFTSRASQPRSRVCLPSPGLPAKTLSINRPTPVPFFYVCSPPPSRIPPAYLTTSQLSFQILSLSQAWLRTFLLLEPRHSHSHIYNQDTKSRHFCAHKYLSSLLPSHPLTRPHALTFSDTATRTLAHMHTHSTEQKNGLACSIPHAITSSVLTHTGDKKERKRGQLLSFLSLVFLRSSKYFLMPLLLLSFYL